MEFPDYLVEAARWGRGNAEQTGRRRDGEEGRRASESRDRGSARRDSCMIRLSNGAGRQPKGANRDRGDKLLIHVKGAKAGVCRGRRASGSGWPALGCCWAVLAGVGSARDGGEAPAGRGGTGAWRSGMGTLRAGMVPGICDVRKISIAGASPPRIPPSPLQKLSPRLSFGLVVANPHAPFPPEPISCAP